MDIVRQIIEYSRECWSAAPQRNKVLALGASGLLVEGEGTRDILVVSVVWAGTPDNSFNLQIFADTGPQATLLAVLQASVRTITLRVHEYGDVIRGPIYCTALGAGATVYGYSVRYRSPLE